MKYVKSILAIALLCLATMNFSCSQSSCTCTGSYACIYEVTYVVDSTGQTESHFYNGGIFGTFSVPDCRTVTQNRLVGCLN